MKKFKSDFVPPNHSHTIISKLTDEIIQIANKAYIDKKDDWYWLKRYHVTATLNIEDRHEILDRRER